MLGSTLMKTKAADAKSVLKAKLDPAAFNAWIAPLEVIYSENEITFISASKFNLDFIRATFANSINEASVECGAEIRFDYKRPQLQVIQYAANVNSKTESVATCADVFNEFVCSEANQFALSAVKKCASGFVPFSPLVVYGGIGSGKTTILNILAKSTSLKVVSTSGAQFITEFVRSMQTNTIFQFKDAMRNCDMFIMDDVAGLVGKKASTEEFLSLLTDLIRAKKNVILSSNIAPNQITGFDKRLVSILSSGLSVDLAAPTAEVAKKILGKSGICESVIKMIAARVPENGHIISGITKKIAAWQELDCGNLSEEVLEKLLGDVLVKQNTPLVMVKNMCAKLGVSFDEIMSSTRTHAIVFARQKIMVALKMSTNLTLSEIGILVGGRDHASVLYAISQIEKAKSTDMLLDSEIKELAR